MNHLEIQSMSVLERLQLMEALWDSLLHENNEITSPEWHESILTERLQSIQDGEAKFISLEELKTRGIS